MKLTSIYYCLSGGTGVFAVLAGIILSPWQNRRFVYGEDGVLEHLSATLFFLAFLLALVHMYRSGSRMRLTCLIALTGLIAALEEISYGLRWFGDVDLPAFYGLPLDGIHDVVSYAVYWFKFDSSQTVVATLALIMSLGIAPVVYCHRQSIFRLMQSIWTDETTYFVLLSITLIFCALFVDAPIIDYDPLQRVEEGMEMLAGLALLFAAISLNREFPGAPVSIRKPDRYGLRQSISESNQPPQTS